MRVRTLLPLVVIALVACTGGSSTTSVATTPTPTGSGTTPTPGGVDPLVPYSPETTPFAERTSGYIPDTLTLPTADGAKLYVTPVTTTMTVAYVHDTRALAVYLTLENPGDTPWSGTIGAHAEIADLTGATFPAETPAKGDVHPNPGQYGGANRSLLQRVRVAPGAIVKGVLVFHPTGGNRPVTLRISLDGGTTWGEWTTALGVF
jgi:hypothetical protein